MAEQRLPKVNQDDGTWGDILRQYLKKEHTDDGTDNAANGGHQHITITASDGTAGTAPIRLTSGTLLSVAAIGAIEFNNDTLYFTKTTGTTRMQVVMDTATQTLTNKTLTDPKIASTIKDANGNTILNLPGQASAVNNWIMKNRASGAGPTLEVEGTDTDIWMNVVPKGNAGVTIYQNTSGQPAKISTDGADTNININMLPKGTGRLQAGGVNVVTTSSADVLTNKTLTSPRIANNGYIADANGNEQIVFGQTASAINEIKVTNAAAGNGPTIAAQGGDTNVDLNLNTKGTGQVKINGSPIPSDANMVHKTGNETIAGDKTFSNVVTLNDITYAKEINITPTNGAPQSAAFTLDNDNGTAWQFTNNSVGDFAFWNQTTAVGPFYIERGAPQDAFKITEGFTYSGQRLDMDGNTISSSVVDLHPESDGFNVFPHMVNDIAYNTRLGGSTIWKKNGVVTLPDYGDDNIFLPDATMASYLGLSNPTTDTITVEVTLHRAFNWGVKWGIVMTPWCCALNVQLEVWDNVAGSWATAYTKTNDNSGMHWVSYAAPTGHDMTKIRWTLTNFNSPDPRITQIAAIQFNSSLLSGPFATRSGGDIYGTYRFWPDVAGQSASIALDNRVNQSWLHATNSSGQLTMYDETNDKTPFLINRNTPTGALTLDTTEIHAQLPVNMHSQKITGVTDPTSAQDAATKAYVDSTVVTGAPHYDGNLIIGGNFQNDANWVNAWGTQTTAQSIYTGGKSHQIVSTGAGAGTDYLALTHDGTGTPAQMPSVADRRYVIQVWARKKNTNTGGGNLLIQTVRTKSDNTTDTIASTLPTSSISNSGWLYFEYTHTSTSGDNKFHQFRLALDSGVPAGDTFYIGGVIVSDLTGGFTTYTGDTLTNKRINPRVVSPSITSSYTINVDVTDLYDIVGQNSNVTFNNPTGTPVNGQKMMVRIKSDATARSITWGSAFTASGVATPITSTIANREHHILFVYSNNSSKWVCLASDAVGY